MKLLIQRVQTASVEVHSQIISSIDFGYLVLLGIAQEDEVNLSDRIEYLVDKLLNLRLFEDQGNKMNLSVLDVQGSILVVSQFTLYANCQKGRRPSFVEAMKPASAEIAYQQFITKLRGCYNSDKIVTGQFGAHMNISLVNDGPVTIMLEK